MEGKLDFIKGAVDSQTNSIKPSEISNVGTFIGEAMGDDEKINTLMTVNKPEITVLVGFVGYGKTSFIASCYQTLLVKGGIGDYKLFDSDTLTGLERRLYLRRFNEELKNVAPATRRTLRGEPHLLSFHLSHPEKGEKVIIISDHSGEDYKEYVDTKAKLEKDILLRNADRIIFFVNCELLLKPAMMEMRQNYVTLIENMKEFSAFRENVKIQFLFNKIDLVKDKRDVYESKKKQFMDKMSSVLGFNVTDCPEVVSNQITNNKTVVDIFSMIVNDNNSLESNFSEHKTELDWVKTILN